MSEIINKPQIENLIPHAGQMCLLDHVESYDDDELLASSVSHFDLENPLRYQDKLSSACAIEYAAQASALHAALNGDSDATKIGLLAQAKNVNLFCQRLDVYQQPLSIQVICLQKSSDSLMYQFNILNQSEKLADGRLLVLLRESI